MEKKITVKALNKYFDTHPAVSKLSIAKEAEVGYSTLNAVLTGDRNLTDNILEKLLPVLKRYGF